MLGVTRNDHIAIRGKHGSLGNNELYPGKTPATKVDSLGAVVVKLDEFLQLLGISCGMVMDLVDNHVGNGHGNRRTRDP